MDKLNGNNLWYNSIQKEMKNVEHAFEVCDKCFTPSELRSYSRLLPVYQEIKCHMIFDIKFYGQFTRKSIFVSGGHMTYPPACITYSSVVYRESVRIEFLLASFLDINILSADIGNAYINAYCHEKIWCEAGKEFGPEKKGSVMIIVRELYGLKSSGASWRSILSQTMVEMGYKSSLTDPDVWLRPHRNPSGDDYYDFCLIYVDDILCVNHNPETTMDEISKLYLLKEGYVGPPKKYLGEDIYRFKCKYGLMVWSMSSDEYVKNMVKNVENILISDGKN